MCDDGMSIMGFFSNFSIILDDELSLHDAKPTVEKFTVGSKDFITCTGTGIKRCVAKLTDHAGKKYTETFTTVSKIDTDAGFDDVVSGGTRKISISRESAEKERIAACAVGKLPDGTNILLCRVASNPRINKEL